jgi:hypothetical protein
MPAVAKGPMLVPVLEAASAPVHPSEPVPPPAVHEVAPTVAQTSWLDWPTWTMGGLAANPATSAGAAPTVRVAVLLALPAGPLQVRVYEYVPGIRMVPVLTAVPEVACVPLQDPEATQLVALVADQFNTAEPPALMFVGLALISMVIGGGVGLALAATLTL